MIPVRDADSLAQQPPHFSINNRLKKEMCAPFSLTKDTPSTGSCAESDLIEHLKCPLHDFPSFVHLHTHAVPPSVTAAATNAWLQSRWDPSSSSESHAAHDMLRGGSASPRESLARLVGTFEELSGALSESFSPFCFFNREEKRARLLSPAAPDSVRSPSGVTAAQHTAACKNSTV